MASSISFTDAIGAATLSNGRAVPMDRFANWLPSSTVIGPKENALGTGELFTFAFRTDYAASFEIRDIPNSQMSIMLRLQRHLSGGGAVSVATGDSAARVYANCKLAPGAEAKIALANPQELLYTFSVALLNLAGADMLCTY